MPAIAARVLLLCLVACSMASASVALEQNGDDTLAEQPHHTAGAEIVQRELHPHEGPGTVEYVYETEMEFDEGFADGTRELKVMADDEAYVNELRGLMHTLHPVRMGGACVSFFGKMSFSDTRRSRSGCSSCSGRQSLLMIRTTTLTLHDAPRAARVRLYIGTCSQTTRPSSVLVLSATEAT